MSLKNLMAVAICLVVAVACTKAGEDTSGENKNAANNEQGEGTQGDGKEAAKGGGEKKPETPEKEKSNETAGAVSKKVVYYTISDA